MLEGMGIHFGGRMNDESRPVQVRLHSSAMSKDGSFQEKQKLDENLLGVGLPPLPPIDNWLIEADRPEEQEESSDHLLDDDSGSVVDDSDSAIETALSERVTKQSASAQRTIPRLMFKPTQAVIVILVLVVALCASLTMLVTQAINYNKQQSETSSHGFVSVAEGKTRDSNQGQESSPKTGGSPGPSLTPGQVQEQKAGTDANGIPAKPPAQLGTPVGQTTGTVNPGSNLVNLNTADSTQLQQIKGVGPVMAQKIIDYRTLIGGFKSVDQLLKVSGIGQKTLEKMRGQVTV